MIERNGGKVVVSAEVREIVIENGAAVGVRMADGREFRSALVVSDAGARNTFERLVRFPENAAPLPIQEDLRRIPGSIAHLSLYVGIKHSAAELGLNGTNLWICSHSRSRRESGPVFERSLRSVPDAVHLVSFRQGSWFRTQAPRPRDD